MSKNVQKKQIVYFYSDNLIEDIRSIMKNHDCHKLYIDNISVMFIPNATEPNSAKLELYNVKNLKEIESCLREYSGNNSITCCTFGKSIIKETLPF